MWLWKGAWLSWKFDVKWSWYNCLDGTEVISGKHYNEKCDIYSWAIIFWEVLARKKPYENFHCREAILFAVPKGLRPQLLQNFSDQIKTLLTKSWTNDPSERPSIGEIEITMNDILSRCDAQNSEPI